MGLFHWRKVLVDIPLQRRCDHIDYQLSKLLISSLRIAEVSCAKWVSGHSLKKCHLSVYQLRPLFILLWIGKTQHSAISLELVGDNGFLFQLPGKRPLGWTVQGKGGHLPVAWTYQLCPQCHGEFTCRIWDWITIKHQLRAQRAALTCLPAV